MPNYDIYIGASPIDIYVSAAQAAVGSGASSFADLTDKATADIPAINTPVATALEAEAAAIKAELESP